MSNQKRRQERIHHLIEKQKVIDQRQSLFLPSKVDEHPRGTPEANYDERMDDPEYVWKNRHNLGWNASTGTHTIKRPRENELRTFSPVSYNFRNRLVLCFILFGLIWGMFQLHNPWAVKGQQLVIGTLIAEFDFEAVALWYNQTFQGAPSFIPTFDLKTEQKVSGSSIKQLFSPVLHSSILTSFASSKQGITLKSAIGSAVFSMDTGIVIYTGHTATTGTTIVIQHANQLQSIYGWVGQSSVNKNDWVKGGEQIGTVSPDVKGQDGALYFAVKQKSKYINPLEVIPLD